MHSRLFGGPARRSVRRIALTSVIILPLAACAGKEGGIPGIGPIGRTTTHGYVISETALEQIPPGSSRDQVLIALGTPSTTATYSNEVFYYISQTRHRPVAFMQDKLVDQRVVAVYFDKNSKVERVANYGMKDGKVFDFVSRTTPTGGVDQNFIQQVLSGVVGFGTNPFGL
jgi:outer membrane protein assembly factor BamE (lipoprotein component of BamABCDE complex)